MKTASDLLTDKLFHNPVMLEESVSYLNPRSGGVYFDATVGMGGHSSAILESEGARLIAIDADPDSANLASRRLERFGGRASVINANFAEIDKTAQAANVGKLDGIIADLGISSRQISQSGRGFSFKADEPLDMRMDTALEITASDIVNTMNVGEIRQIIKKYGEDKFAGNIASAIVKSREQSPVSTSRELALIVSNSIPARFHPPSTHPATRTFQALRIKVNNEIANLETFLEKAVPLLNKGARIVVISFHSLEDRVVKRAFKFMSLECVCPPGLVQCCCGKQRNVRLLTRKPVSPSLEEIKRNPRARSAKMRVAEKV